MADALFEVPRFSPEMLTLARQALALTQGALARQVGVAQGTISKMEAGVTTPSEADIAELSAVLRFTPKFFEQHRWVEGPGLTELYHRKRQKVSANRLNQIYATAEIRRMHMETLLRSWEPDQEDNFAVMPVDQYEGDVEKIARTVRAMWQLPTGPIFSMTRVIEHAGGIILSCEFGTRHVDGFSRRSAKLPPIFCLNQTLLPDRWRWTLAHELGHLTLHTEPSDQMELEADRFAGEFLAPASEIKSQLWDLSFQKLAGLKRYWKISMQALITRAFHLSVITERRRRHMYMQISRAGYRMREPDVLDPPKEPPELLSRIIAFHQERLGYTRAELEKMLMLRDQDFADWYPQVAPRLHLVE